MSGSLSQWQARFRELIFTEACGEGLFELAPGPGPGDRLDAYRGGHWLRVSESLRDDFPLTERFLRKNQFAEKIREFLKISRAYEIELGEMSKSFAEFMLAAQSSDSLRRALHLDLLALEVRLAPEPEKASSSALSKVGLHPTVRFYGEGTRAYILWRAERRVCRERVSCRDLSLLRCFEEPGSLDEIGARLEALREEPGFVERQAAFWSSRGLIILHASSG